MTSYTRSIRISGALMLAAAVFACDDQVESTAPRSAVGSAALNTAAQSTVPNELTADALTRILPGLEPDAATPVGNALRALDAKLHDPGATLASKQRAAATVQHVLTQFADLPRPDEADLAALRLEADDISAALR